MTVEKIAIIHTGFHKTASSSIQHSLANNRQLLTEHGYDYPQILVKGVVFYNQSIPLYGRYCDAPELFKHYWFHNNLDADIANRAINHVFEEELWSREKLIFSDEYISSLSVSGLQRLRDDFQRHGYKVRVISYIREPFNLIVSNIQQRSRSKSIQSIIESNQLARQIEKIEALIQVFNDSAEFYSFEKTCQHELGPVGFFFELLNIQVPVENILKVNEGMSIQAVRLQSYINLCAPILIDKKTIHPLRKKSDLVALSKMKGDKFQLNSRELEQVKPKVAKARQSIIERLGDDFLPEVHLKSNDSLYWGKEQLDFLLALSKDLDLHLLLRIHDFLDKSDIQPEANLQYENLVKYIQRRLNKESQWILFKRNLVMKIWNGIRLLSLLLPQPVRRVLKEYMR